MRLTRWSGVVAAAVIGLAFGTGTAHAGIPIGKSMSGKATYYNDKGYGACGTLIDASSQDLVAVSPAWWTSANPNNDPLCKGISVQVTYQGKTIKVPVRDKCLSCDATHIDLSQTAFLKFAPLNVGVINGITWKFVK
ncbi:cysteine/serine endopeptidase inhibitor [Streptomyces sp. NPDC002221]|uniref:cysteine/serine endopeptidase inhibitor n=1 Tax=Streptomyces sp. NPDC002221 TaxID=3364639 RepID=UPI00367BA5C8